MSIKGKLISIVDKFNQIQKTWKVEHLSGEKIRIFEKSILEEAKKIKIEYNYLEHVVEENQVYLSVWEWWFNPKYQFFDILGRYTIFNLLEFRDMSIVELLDFFDDLLNSIDKTKYGIDWGSGDVVKK